MKQVHRVLIVGAGIGGLTAAVALRRVGVDVDVVEERLKGGAVYHVGIILQANVLHALESLDLAQGVIAAGFSSKGLRYVDARTGALLDERPSIQASGFEHLPDLGIARPALHDVLDRAARENGAMIRLGVTYQSLTPDDRGVDVTLTDGTTARYDLVLAADGAYSRTRRLLFGEKWPNRFTGQSVWRYNLPRPRGLDWAVMYEGIRGRKAGVMPLSNDSMYVLLTSEEPGNPRMPPERLASLFRERLADFGGLIAEMRDSIVDSKLVVHRPLEGVFVRDPWYVGRVLLIGDAVHTPTPHLAMGAGMAIEDAVVLAQLIEAGHSLEALLPMFMQRRFDRCREIWEASVQMGEWEMNPVPEANVPALARRVQRLLAQPL